MVALLGVGRNGLYPSNTAMRMLARGAFAVIIWGCEGEGLVVGGERPQPGAGGEEPGGPGTINGPTPPDVAILEDCPPTPGERQGLLGCWPTPHLGAWRGFFTGVPRYETVDGVGAEFPPGDLVLRIAVDGSGQLMFGVPPASSSAALEPSPSCDAPERPPGCEQLGRLIAGFAYRLEEIALYDRMFEPETRIAGEPPFERPESMDFEVRVGQPWDGWCSAHAAEPDVSPARCRSGECEKAEGPARTAPLGSGGVEAIPGCRCDGEGCRPDAASLFIRLAMSDDQGSLRGTYVPGEASFGAARLEFRKEPEP